MKTLYVLRHAKSSWDHPELADFERPLNKRGKKAAPFMGELMREKGLVPEIIVSSPAERAKTTARLVAGAAGFDAEIVFERGIYESGAHNLVYIVAEIEDRFGSAMIVGHNPGFEGIVRVLTGRYERMPTAALAVIDLDIGSWSETAPDTGELREVLRPKEQMN